jgi:hypothetical protein
LRIDEDAAIHFLIGHRRPNAGETDFGALVRGAVEAFGKRARNVGWFEATILRGGGHGAEISDFIEHVAERRAIVGADFDERTAYVFVRLADGDFLDAKRGPVRRDAVEGFRQHQAIDDMSVNFDVFEEAIGCFGKFAGQESHGVFLSSILSRGARSRVRTSRNKHGEINTETRSSRRIWLFSSVFSVPPC